MEEPKELTPAGNPLVIDGEVKVTEERNTHIIRPPSDPGADNRAINDQLGFNDRPAPVENPFAGLGKAVKAKLTSMLGRRTSAPEPRQPTPEPPATSK